MNNTDAAGELARAFEPALLRVLTILDGGESSTETDAAAARASLLESLDAAALAAAARHSPHATLTARRFVTAWADERLASDDWPAREAWRARPLQSDWGEGRAAGEWFFDAVARLAPPNMEDAALAALALRCMTLGFDGKMYYTPRETADLRRTLVLRFGLARPPAPFPPPAESGGADRPRAGGWSRWLAPLAAAAVLAGAYLLADRSLALYMNGGA